VGGTSGFRGGLRGALRRLSWVGGQGLGVVSLLTFFRKKMQLDYWRRRC
jgi:hypothetical protein